MSSMRYRLAGVVTLALLLSGCGSAFSDLDDQTADGASFDERELRMPKHGKNSGRERKFENWLVGDGDCAVDAGTLKISVPAGDETYYVRLDPRRSDRIGPDVIVRPGRSVSVGVAVCGEKSTYDLYFAAGTRWYGYDSLFGPGGAYSRADEVFPFENGTGWSVSLSLTPAGNLSQSDVDYRDFVR